jgi:hypothetical protein
LLTAKKGNKEREQERQKESDDSTSAIAAASAAGIDLGWIGSDWIGSGFCVLCFVAILYL